LHGEISGDDCNELAAITLSGSIQDIELEETAMSILKWALVFFVISVIAAVLGFGGIAEGAADIAQFLFWAFVVIFVILLVLGLTIYRSVT
jgi:uncharacterized membrane protein YtjA (UPF0391 family)